MPIHAGLGLQGMRHFIGCHYMHPNCRERVLGIKVKGKPPEDHQKLVHPCMIHDAFSWVVSLLGFGLKYEGKHDSLGVNKVLWKQAGEIEDALSTSWLVLSHRGLLNPCLFLYLILVLNTQGNGIV